MRLAIAGAAALFSIAGAAAQDNGGPTVRFDLLNIEGLIVGTTLKVDAAYGQTHGVTIKTPFSFLVPTEGGLAIFVENATAEDSTYIKVNFATEDRQLVENIQFVPISIGLADRQVRLDTLAKLLVEQAFPIVVANYPENNMIGWRETTLGAYDAIEVLGEYIDPANGHMYARVVGYLNTDAPETVMAIANISARFTPIDDPSQFSRTRSGVAMNHFAFIEE
jgi:hypothetical protein